MNEDAHRAERMLRRALVLAGHKPRFGEHRTFGRLEAVSVTCPRCWATYTAFVGERTPHVYPCSLHQRRASGFHAPRVAA